ncbi:MAG: TIGR03757 family integrating conjugative element protein [Halomonadaceae bacterium]|jgi:integrating conjugative element protein (TIGR03757 family)
MPLVLNRFTAALGLGACLAASCASAAPLAETIEVFTVAGQPVTNVPNGVAVIELDAPARLDLELSRGLPEDPVAAEAIMRERMRSDEWLRAVQEYGDLHTGLARAWILGVEKVPAVVMGGAYVVYGQPDVQSAIVELERGRARQ